MPFVEVVSPEFNLDDHENHDLELLMNPLEVTRVKTDEDITAMDVYESCMYLDRMIYVFLDIYINDYMCIFRNIYIHIYLHTCIFLSVYIY